MTATGDDWESDFDGDDWPGEDDEETLVVSCPSCGADVYEDAEQCPVCGDYIVHAAGVWSGKPVWWILLGLVGVVAVIVVLAGLVR
jgi:hypothetical protein